MNQEQPREFSSRESSMELFVRGKSPILETTPTPPTRRTRSQEKAKMAAPTFTKADEMVTFIIGPQSGTEKFVVHKEFACHYSSVLKVAFNSRFIEGQTQTYQMTDVTPGTFRMFVQWLYTQKIRVIQLLPFSEESSLDNDLKNMQLAALWILAKKLLIPTLQNATIETIAQIGDDCGHLPRASFNYIYTHTHDRDSPLRRLAVAQCMVFLNPIDTRRLNLLPRQLLLELTSHLLQHRPGKVEVNAQDFFVPTEKDDGNGNGS